MAAVAPEVASVAEDSTSAAGASVTAGVSAVAPVVASVAEDTTSAAGVSVATGVAAEVASEVASVAELAASTTASAWPRALFSAFTTAPEVLVAPDRASTFSPSTKGAVLPMKRETNSSSAQRVP